jgi:hypothetical protein
MGSETTNRASSDSCCGAGWPGLTRPLCVKWFGPSFWWRVTWLRTRAACAALIRLETPPGDQPAVPREAGTRPGSVPGPRSRCRPARTLSTMAWSSARTGRHPAERSAATATERALSGSFLFVLPEASSRTGAPQPGRHVQNLLPGRDQLPVQQVPQAASPSGRPDPLRPGRRPRQQPLSLSRRGPDPHLAQRLLSRADHHRSMRALIGVHAISTAATSGPLSSWMRTIGSFNDPAT